MNGARNIEVGWYLFKSSGKLAYSGVSTIPYETWLWDENFIRLIDDNQRDVVKGTIMRRSFTLVTFDLPKYDKDINYQKCFTHQFPNHDND